MVEYDRDMLRSTFVSVFWAAICERRKGGKLTFQSIADRIGTGKSAVSRWFSGDAPNWTLDTIADLAGAIDLEIHVTATDRRTGAVITAGGVQSAPVQPTSAPATETEPSRPTRIIKAPFSTAPETEALTSANR